MIPIGYMLKTVVEAPTWMNAPKVECVYSVGNHVSGNFLDYIPLWRHNGWWLFDDPTVLRDVAMQSGLSLSSLTMFYYEAFEREYDRTKREWSPIYPKSSFHTAVMIPDRRVLRGYDVVTFSAHTSPECSPLSCNSYASTFQTNRFCLFDDMQPAKVFAEWVEHEPGPYCIIAIYTLS
jgi:hypothetical protein